MKDSDIYLDVVARLETTGQFAAVLYGVPPNDGGIGADVTPVVFVNPNSFTEADDVDPIQIVRVCVGSIVISVRHDDHNLRTQTLDKLAAVVANAINGQSLAGETILRMTTVPSGKYDVPVHPEQRLILVLQFAYFVAGDDGRDDT